MTQPNTRIRDVARRAATLAIVASALLPLACAYPADASVPRISKADDYPHKSIRVIDPFPAAGAGDIIARTVGQKFAERNGQAFVVDNRPGAGGNVAAEMAARATPDGYTLFDVIVYSLAPSASLYPQSTVDPMRDFAYITLLAGGSFVIVAYPSFPAQTIPELVALAKSQPGKIGYASSGVGGPVHMAGELFKSRAGINLLHVPYKGAAPAITDVMGNQVVGFFGDIPGVIGFIKGGRLKAIGIAAPTRHPLLPDVPTLDEQGIRGVESSNWYALFAPAKTPPAKIEQLNAAVRRALDGEPAHSRLTESGAEPKPGSPAELAALVKSDTAKWGKLIADKKIKGE